MGRVRRVWRESGKRRTASCAGNMPTLGEGLEWARLGPGEGDAGSMPSLWILVPMELKYRILSGVSSGEMEEGRSHRILTPCI